MSIQREVSAAAKVMRSHVAKRARYERHPSQKAVVINDDPLTAELVQGKLILDEDDLILSQWARRYDIDHEIQIGDTLILHSVDGGDYYVTDVVTAELSEIIVEPWNNVNPYVHPSGTVQPGFKIGWANVSGYAAGFYKDPHRNVRLRGRVTKVGVFVFHPAGPGGIPAAYTETVEPDTPSASTIFTLPVGYRPSQREHFIVPAGSPDGTGRVDVTTAGDVLWVSGPASEPDYMTLTGINFRAE